MAEVLIVNPKRRRKATTRRRKPTTRTVARKRTTPRVKRRSRTVTTYRANPAPRPAVRRRRLKSNPIKLKLPKGLVRGQIMPAALGAAGALAVDALIGNIPLIPVSLKTGPVRHATKAVAAIGLGMLAENVVKKDTARTAAIGALTVTAYNAGRELLSKFAPQLQLGYYEDVAAGIHNTNGLGYWNTGMVTGYSQPDQLGYYETPDMFSQPVDTGCECPEVQ